MFVPVPLDTGFCDLSELGTECLSHDFLSFLMLLRRKFPSHNFRARFESLTDLSLIHFASGKRPNMKLPGKLAFQAMKVETH